MMKISNGRLILNSISHSESFAVLSKGAALLFLLLIPHYNSYGKMLANPEVIKETVCPEIPYLSEEVIEQALHEISDWTDVKYFQVGDDWYLHSLKFDEHQARLIRADRRGLDVLPDYPGLQEASMRELQGVV